MLRVLTCAEGAVPGPAQVDPRAFPLRLVVDLGPLEEAVASVAVVDHRPGRKVRERVVRTRAGDAVLFAARQRLDRVGGVYGLQLVRWRFGPFAVERWLLDVPFDDG